MDEIKKKLARFPKTRPPLGVKASLLYEKEYAINRTGSGIYSIVRFLESWMHRKIAASHIRGALLEIGAGGLNHVPYERNVTKYDVIEPLGKQLSDKSPYKYQVNKFYTDYHEMLSMIDTHQYDRIISIAVFEHLENLPFILAASSQLLSETGILQVGIPSEGGMLWGIGWRLTTGISYRLRTGLNYKKIIRHEHINTLDEILLLIKYLFEDFKIEFFPCLGKHGSFYCYVEAAKPFKAKSREILNQCEKRRGAGYA